MEAARVHHASRRRGGRIADSSASVAAENAGDGVSQHQGASQLCEPGRRVNETGDVEVNEFLEHLL